MGVPVAAMLDTKGPEIRTRTFAAPPVNLEKGQTFTLTTREVVGTNEIVGVTYQNLHNELSPGCTILIDDGLIGLRVNEIQGQDIICTVESGGPLSNHKSINLPGVKIALPSLTEQDRSDLIFACEQDFDFVAASFVRKADDVKAIRQVLDEHGGKDIRIISKIENQEGVDNLDDIIAVSDGIMVARGDLGVEIPAPQVPVLQKRMISHCLKQGKIVITATQMLDSMIRNPRPTRAEVSDVANAVFDGSSCVMLSGETASGKYPVEALKTMVDIVMEAEKSIHYWKRFAAAAPKDKAPTINDAITHTCCMTARDLNAKAILCASSSGHTARMISRFRPECPIVALTLSEKVRRQLALHWGVIPCLTGNVDSTDRLFSLCAENAWKERLVENGDTVVITAGVPIGQSGSTNLIKAQVIDIEELS
jgi:pyruvate kinase